MTAEIRAQALNRNVDLFKSKEEKMKLYEKQKQKRNSAAHVGNAIKYTNVNNYEHKKKLYRMTKTEMRLLLEGNCFLSIKSMSSLCPRQFKTFQRTRKEQK